WTEEQGPMLPMMPFDDEEEEAEAAEEGGLTAENALLMMLLMLQSGEQGFRMAAARTLGYLGYFQAVNRLYQALSDYEEPIRITAYAALADLQTQIGQSFPGVMQQSSN
ncbi:MAG: HEAT repeat domain-containing protein, partial [Anaerolineae bacterium]|nr:HEAT repeat domain-containing protein [Anaerolineae bacterium]